ncbi:MAG TPA: hypothetical protein VIK69_00185 [Methylophilaceae bacterium]|jgi:plastocyanin
MIRNMKEGIRRGNLLVMQVMTACMLTVLCAMQPAQAEGAPQHRMILSHHEFEPWDFTPKVGDRIEIVNTSDIVHSIYITYPDGAVLTLGDVQLPGQSVIWEVPAAGEYLFKCWIHPVINARMQVQPD